MSPETSTNQTLQVRAAVNRWISDEFPEHRRHLSHTSPSAKTDGSWRVQLTVRDGSRFASLGELEVGQDLDVFLNEGTAQSVIEDLYAFLKDDEKASYSIKSMHGQSYDFRFGDGISGSTQLEDGSVDLLLTDPPYSISNPYTCEGQVPRRLRKNGRDFIMPKGHFGQWDYGFSPDEWTSAILPKVKGWAVFFCAQEQIGEYSEILRAHKFFACWNSSMAEDESRSFQSYAQANQRMGSAGGWQAARNEVQRTRGAQCIRTQIAVAARTNSPDAKACRLDWQIH